MDQIKTGHFFKELRKQKGLTQDQLADQFHVSNRTVSRWETGNTMPDLDILLHMADFYEVDLRELLDGERKHDKMNKEMEETVLKIADCTMEEKNRLMMKLHVLAIIGVIACLISIVLEAMNLADQGIYESIADFSCGFAFGVLIIAVIYTSHYIGRFRAFKKRKLLHK